MNINAYNNLNDAAERHGLPELGVGPTEVYYLRMGDPIGAGGDRCGILAQFGLGEGRPWHPTASQFLRLWKKVGSIACTDKERIFGLMQGEVWSPNGEARIMVRRDRLDHTSMSVGDMICIDGTYWICRATGWEEWHEN